MKEKIYKYTAITFVIINIITLYFLYDFLTAERGMFQGLGLFFDFARLIFFSVGLGIIILICRLYFYIKKKKNYLKTNFIYVFTAFFCLNTLINLLICFSLGLLAFKIEGLLTALILLIISIFMLFDIYRNNFIKSKNQINEA
jgi:hypothetical protein